MSRILIVEDQSLIVADLESTLAKFGHHVVGSAPSGEEAIAQADDLRPDLILMDVRLRGQLDGIATAAAIRERQDIPIVYLTAYADEETFVRAKETGPFGYLVKPFNDRELRAAVEIALYKSAADRERTDARARLMAAEEYRVLIDGIADYAIYRTDRQGKILTWNAGAGRLTGYSPDEAIGAAAAMLCEHNPTRDPAAYWDEVIAAGRGEHEGWLIRRDGSRFWGHCVTTPLRDCRGAVVGFGNVVRDLTDRRRHEAEQRFLSEATVALGATLDVERGMVRIAELATSELADFCAITRIDEDGQLRILAMHHADAAIDRQAQDLAAEARAAGPSPLGLQRVAQTGEAQLLVEIPAALLAAAESLSPAHAELSRIMRPRSLLAVPVQVDGGRVGGVITLVLGDPNPRRFGPQDLALMQQLAQRCGMAFENARLFTKATDAVRARDEFLAVASHELKTPLTPLQLQLDLIRLTLSRSGFNDERLQERLEAASRQTVRLTRLVEGLLDVSRISAGQLTLDRERCEFNAIVHDVVARFQEEARRAGSELVVQPCEPVMGHWDRMRVDQILSNLLSNAVKYGAAKPMEVAVVVKRGVVQVAVRDFGIGIAPEAVTRIFNRFERAVSFRHYGGLGLGLFIARECAEAHGGTLICQSELGAGSTFTLALPCEAPAHATEQVAAGDV